MNKIYFISDTHFGHKNILHYTPSRCEVIGVKCYKDNDEWKYIDLTTNQSISEQEAVKRMDEWIIRKWNERVDKKDEVYVLGDFSFYGVEETQKIFHKLHGKKHLIIGNHDSSGESIQGWVTKKQLHLIDIKKSRFDWLSKTLRIFMSHFPMISWWSKEYGSIMLHGHCHGRINDLNNSQPDLRLDVGMDGEKFMWSLEEVYEHMVNKAKTTDFESYTKLSYQKL